MGWKWPWPLRLDVTDAPSIDAAVQAVLQRYGRIDVLANNAGYALRGAVEEVDVEAVRSMFDTNVLGIIRMVRAVAPIMRRQVSGRIVNVGSLAGKFGTTRARLCPGRPERKLSVCHPGGCQSPAGYYPTGYGKTTRAARFSHPMVRVSLSAGVPCF